MPVNAKVLSFLADGGEMGALMRAKDWSSTPLGDPEHWPQSLKTVVRLILTTRHPMFIFWGPDSLGLYNDAYRASLGPEKHPSMLGQPGKTMWPEIWPIIGPQIDFVLRGEGATWHEDALVPIFRNGAIQDVYWTYSYSPIDDVSAPNGIGGVLVVCRETTTKVVATQRLAAERESLARLFDQAPSFMAVLGGPEHRFEQVNPAYRRLVDHRDVIGKTVAEIVPEAVGQGYVALLDAVYRTGKAFSSTGAKFAVQSAANGPVNERFLDFVYDAIRDSEGTIIGVFVEGHDVTERSAALMALAASEGRFRALAQAMPNHAWTATPAGALNWFNDRVYEFSGAKVGELDGAGWAVIVHPDDAPRAEADWHHSVSTGETYEQEFRIRRHDGQYHWHIVRALPIRAEDGTIAMWTGTNTDIQAQRQATEALLASERRFRLSQEAARIGSMEVDVETGEVLGSDKLWEIWGLEGRASAHIDELIHLILPEDRHLSSTPETRREGTASPAVEYRIRRPDTGEVRWLSRRIEFAYGGDNKPVKMFGVMQDVTDLKEAEARSRVLTHELEHRIKNILAIVSAIAQQTLRNADIETASATFTARLRALANAHDILTKNRWEVADLDTVVRGALSPVMTDRITVAGPPVSLDSKSALSLALAVNELATNAVKYGALSSEAGWVAIRWSVDGPADDKGARLAWLWEERGGPPVAPPSRRGFGTILIEKVLASDFRGEVRIEYLPEGFTCRLTAPAPQVQ